MESSWQDLFIDMVAHTFIFENYQIMLLPCFTFILKAVVPKQGLFVVL